MLNIDSISKHSSVIRIDKDVMALIPDKYNVVTLNWIKSSFVVTRNLIIKNNECFTNGITVLVI